MKSISRAWRCGLFPLAVLVSVLLSCGRAPSPAPQPAPPEPERKAEIPVSDVPDPLFFSYQASLGNAPLSEVPAPGIASNDARSAVLPAPFPDSLLVAANGLDAAGLTIGIPGDGNRYDASAWGEARRGDFRYRIIDGTFLAAAQALPQGNDGEDERKERDLWRYRSSAAIVAGPVVFDDLVLIATDAPSFIAVDRNTGNFAFERPLRTSPRGPLFFLSGLSLVSALGSDGTLCLYSVVPEESVDPVEAFLMPSAAALPLIEKRLADRLGKREERPVIVFHPYGPRSEVPASGTVLFRADFASDQRSRLYVENAASRPFLLEIFSASGEVLTSNIEYTVEAVLEFGFEAGKTYYIAVALLSEKGESNAAVSLSPAVPRLVIAPK